MWRISGVIDGVLVNALVEMVPEMAIRLLRWTTVETVVHLINQNAKAKYHVKIDVDAEYYYGIKDSEKSE